MRVYVIEVCREGFTSNVSQEGYDSLEKAQAFIEGRGDKPQYITPYHYRSGETANGVWHDFTDYLIHDILVR